MCSITHLLEWSNSRTLTAPNAARDVEQQELSLLVEGQNGTATLEDRLAVSYKTKHTLTIDPAIMLLCIYPKELKSYVYTKTCTQMLIAALFIIAKTLKQPRCPSVDKWINRLWYIETIEYYSTLKRNGAIKPWKDVEEPWLNITKWKKPIWKSRTTSLQLFDILEKAKL